MPAIGLRTNRYQQAQRRKQLLPYAIGTWCPCGQSGECTHARCDGLMVDPDRMQLDHTLAVALGGGDVPGDRIICAHCNQSSGATLGNQMRDNRASRDW